MRNLIIATFAFILVLLASNIVFAYRVITNLNDLSRDVITDQHGNINYDLFDRLKSDGTDCMHVNTNLTEDERLEVYRRMGPGIVMVADGSFMTGNYTELHQLTGYVDLYLSYNEEWFY